MEEFDTQLSLRSGYRPANPRQNAKCCNVMTFKYTMPMFKKGMKQKLTEVDLYKTLKEDRSGSLGQRLMNKWYEQLAERRPSLFKAIVKTFGHNFAGYCCVLLFLELCKISQPVALYYLLIYYLPNNNVQKHHAYLCVTALVTASLLYVLIAHCYLMGLQHIGMRIRVACCSIIYRKCLKLSQQALSEFTMGQILNLLGNDVSRFDYVCIHLPMLVVLPIEFVLTIFLMYCYAGVIPLSGFAVVFLTISLQFYFGKKFSEIRLKTAYRTDERVRQMNEIISGIQVIKMYTWEEAFLKKIAEARKVEIREIQKACSIKALNMSFAIFVSRLAVYVAVVLYVSLGNIPTPQFAFVVVAFFNIIRQTFTVVLPLCVTQIAEAGISIKRIQAFLESEEVIKFNSHMLWKPERDEKSNFDVELFEASVSWEENKKENVLDNVSFTLKKQTLTGIIGQVGAGKSTLLQVLLDEVPLKYGHMQIRGTVSYFSQEPWLFSSTIKRNILFGRRFIYERYMKVTEVCALRRDLSQLPHGDDTLIGEKGVMLSGGQRARVGLARAIYREADIYLLDDPLSAVDSEVGQQIFEDCIRNFLNGKTVLLVTHQVQYLKDIPNIILLKHGRKQFEGTYDELQKEVPEFSTLLDDVYNRDTDDIDTKLAESDLRQVQSRSQHTYAEKTESGKVVTKMYWEYISAGSKWFCIICVPFLFICTQALVSATDYFLVLLVNFENHRSAVSEDDTLYISIYTVLIASLIVVTIIRSQLFFVYCMTASKKLHDRMLRRIIDAPISFFQVNPSGIILNRFSKDLFNIDEQLPFVALDTLQNAMLFLGITILSSMVNPWLLIPIAVMLVVFYFLRRAYLRTGRDLKRLEATTKSPIFTHVTTSLQGLTSIRAYDAEATMESVFDSFQDLHSSAWHSYISASRAFGYWLDVICVVYIILAGYSLLVFREPLGSNVGLVLTQTLALTGMFQWCIRQWTELETIMTCVERVLDYSKLEPEQLYMVETTTVPPDWPENGTITFKNVYMSYSVGGHIVLHDLNFTINASEKIGIVGRTGAGKSSLISALFQLSNTSGSIIIDGIDTRKIELRDLRSKLSIIPQSPVLFAGTLRSNLDPYGETSDEQLWLALEEVEMFHVVKDLPGSLSCTIQAGGANFSIGQRQLLCLARAIIRKHKILILDEATANVDPETDFLIQETIRQKFKNCTVLTIAHRLNTVLESDRILVMDEGKVVEFDTPYALLENKGKFYEMVQRSGKIAGKLMQTIRDHYERKLEQEEEKEEEND